MPNESSTKLDAISRNRSLEESRVVSLRIDYVSPLPPVRSGIADYSADLLPELAARCELRLTRLPGQHVEPALLARHPVVPLEQVGGDGRLPLYQVGNNRYHEAVVARAMHAPGVVTLHDLFLHHLLQERTLRHHDLDGYVEALVADHGWVGAAVALPPRWGAFSQAGLFALPARRSLLARQRGVLVHGDWARRELEEDGLATPVRVVPMPMPVPVVDPAAAASARRRWGVPEGAFVIGSFGFQTPIKRTEAVIGAIARPGLESAHLLVVGESSPAVDLERTAREAGVLERVHRFGYVLADDYATAVLACDVCANLRHPTAGETSASLLRLFALGRGAVVSDYGQFAELPDDVVVRAPLPAVAEPDEVEALAHILYDLARSPERLRAMGEAALRRVVERHDPARAAESLVRACGELAELPPGGGATERFVPAPTTLTWGAVRGSIEVEGLDGWLPGERRTLRVVVRNAGFARWLTPEDREGGIAIECRLSDERGTDHVRLPWLPLPRSVAPGEEVELELVLRRPPGPAVLTLRPLVIGGGSFAELGGPTFESTLDG
jgi:glycosyltransferase involved in cell wall biosynthesis